jgi:hypothetical protein
MRLEENLSGTFVQTVGKNRLEFTVVEHRAFNP